MKKIIHSLFFIIFTTHVAYAQTCPRLADIKANKQIPGGWQLLEIYPGSTLEQILPKIDKFTSASTPLFVKGSKTPVTCTYQTDYSSEGSQHMAHIRIQSTAQFTENDFAHSNWRGYENIDGRIDFSCNQEYIVTACSFGT